jgi:hypothetical protein
MTGMSIHQIITSFNPLTSVRWDKMRKPAKFLHEARSTLILHAFGTLLMLLAAMIVTISGKSIWLGMTSSS